MQHSIFCIALVLYFAICWFEEVTHISVRIHNDNNTILCYRMSNTHIRQLMWYMIFLPFCVFMCRKHMLKYGVFFFFFFQPSFLYLYIRFIHVSSDWRLVNVVIDFEHQTQTLWVLLPSVRNMQLMCDNICRLPSNKEKKGNGQMLSNWW